ncbi:hypothetical protein FD09_GL001571 [Schleiferilactobacillus perolens DSM 12744]|uniref:Uncharacterized protein n=2 Tax=Schleiferilactobacillus perolens TaxID=100468 RepID=A0A0R1MWJ5_9LACO|nr:hypothetical protein FD09_GL001571 [Schleiferilactobacillus perolens DSM 12744]
MTPEQIAAFLNQPFGEYKLSADQINMAVSIKDSIAEGMNNGSIVLADQSYTDAFETKLNIETRGKGTMAVKAAVAVIKATLKRIGKSAWDGMVKKIETATATQLVYFHWQAINKTLQTLTNFEGHIEDAIIHFLTQHGMNAWLAGVVTRLAITLLL